MIVTPNRLSRREVLRTSAGLAGAALAWAAGPDLKFPTAPRDRLAVASWPFHAYIDSPGNDLRDKKLPGMDLVEFVSRVRKEFDVPGVEPLDAHFASTEPRYLDRLRAAMEKAGVHAVNLPVDNRSSYYDAEPAVRNQAVENGKKWIDVARAIGSPSVRTSIARAANAKPNVDIAAAEIRKVADYAASKDIVVNLENDNLVSEDALFLVKLVEKVNHPYLHTLPDFCNSMLKGDEKFNYDALTALFRHAYNICHVKDSEVGEGGKVYRIDLDRSFGILKAAHYRGYCSMEFEGQGSPYEGTRKLIRAALKSLA